MAEWLDGPRLENVRSLNSGRGLPQLQIPLVASHQHYLYEVAAPSTSSGARHAFVDRPRSSHLGDCAAALSGALCRHQWGLAIRQVVALGEMGFDLRGARRRWTMDVCEPLDGRVMPVRSGSHSDG